MTIRPATAEDVEAVAALEESMFGTDAWSTESVREELTGPRRTAVVACAPDVVGYVVTADAGDVTDVQRIAVSAEHRRQGLARALLADVLRTDRRMLLEVGAHNDAALAFYAAAGFVEIDRRPSYYRDGSDAVVMERIGP
jgi:ribosomal-protein-alanine N-acetyltransferase